MRRMDLGVVYRGGTIRGFSFRILEGGEVVFPTNICMWLVSHKGKLLHDYSGDIIVGGDGRIHIPDLLTTTDYPLGTCKWDVRVTLPDGIVGTYLSGSVVVRKGVSECQKLK